MLKRLLLPVFVALLCPLAFAQATSTDVRVIGFVHSPAQAGNDSYMSISASNHGTIAASHVVVTSTAPAGTTFTAVQQQNGFDSCSVTPSTLRCTINSFTANAGATVGAIIHVGTGMTNGAMLTFTTTASSDTPDPITSNNTSTSSMRVVLPADLALTISASPYVAGEIATLRVTLTNNGPNIAFQPSATLNVHVVWRKQISGPAVSGGDGTGTISTGRLGTEPGDNSIVFDLGVDNTPASADAQWLVSGTTSMENEDTNPADNHPTLYVKATSGSADLSMTGSAPANAAPGDTIAFGVSVINKGPSDATDVQIHWSVPSNASFVSASGTGVNCSTLTPGATSGSITCSGGRMVPGYGNGPVAATFTTKAVSGGPLKNVATLSSSTPLRNPVDDQVNAETAVYPSNAVDLAATIRSSAPRVAAGSPVSIIAVAACTSYLSATDSTVTVTLPAGFSVTSVAPSQFCSGTAPVTCKVAEIGDKSFVVTVNGTAPSSAGHYTASVTATNANEWRPANNTASAAFDVVMPADLAVTMTGPARVEKNGNVAFSAKVFNNGPSAATNLLITIGRPAFAVLTRLAGSGDVQCINQRCTLASLPSGASVSVNGVAAIPDAAPDGVAMFSAVVDSDADLKDSNDHASLPVVVGSVTTDLQLTLLAPATVQAGALVPLHATVHNASAGDSGAVELRLALPAGTAFHATDDGVCQLSDDVTAVVCQAANLAGGADLAFDFALVAPAQAGQLALTVQVGTVSATASVDVVYGRRRTSH